MCIYVTKRKKWCVYCFFLNVRIFKNTRCVRINFIDQRWIYIYVWLVVQIATGKDDKGLKLYDPGYLNTAPVRSSISYTDGDKGILRYRGYPIEELAESSTFLEVAYLLSKFCIIIIIIIIIK